jgi:hypothetical protein
MEIEFRRVVDALPGMVWTAHLDRTTRGRRHPHRAREVVRRRGSARPGSLVHTGGEAGGDFFGIERCGEFGCGRGYGRAILVADPRHADNLTRLSQDSQRHNPDEVFGTHKGGRQFE